MSDTIQDNIYDKLNDLYLKTSYFSRYSSDLLITAVICTIVFLIISYFHILNNIQPIKDDWSNQRCNPSVIPFAGLINTPAGESSLEFTSSNFTNCTQSILEEIASYALMPLYYAMSLITDLFQDLANALNSIRAYFDTFRNSTSSKSSEIYNRTLNIMTPIISIVQYIRSVFGKIQGSSTAAIYTLYGGYITLNSTLFFIYDTVVAIMWAISGIIIGCFAIGWLVPPMLATGISLAAFLTILLIPAVVMVVIMQDIFKSSGLKSTPSVPHYCFSENTLINTINDEYIKIKDIQIGDVLKDGSKVTAIMKSTSANIDMYELNGILVSGHHMIYDNKNGWIKANKHIDSKLIEDFREPYLYCINTDTKTILINGIYFADWDEIDERDLIELKTSNKSFISENDNFNKFSIHHYFDTGFHPDTILYLENGNSINIKEIEVNDVLQFGEIVKTIVKINCDDLDRFYLYKANNKELFKGTSNLDITNHSLEQNIHITKEKISSPKYAYHIVTNTGYIHINGLIIGDYNKGIEQHLSEENIREYFI